MFVKTPKLIQRLFPSLVCRKKNSQNNIWLTFDDGPCPKVTTFILKILKEEKVKATFFLVGKSIQKYPELFSEIIKEGHVVANHSYSHKNGWISNNSTYLHDVEMCQNFMPKNKLFRPPYGKISMLQIKELKKKYKIILWDVLSRDFDSNIGPGKVKNNVLFNTSTGSILVFHNNHKSLRNLKPILQATIRELKKRGMIFSTTW